MTDDTIGKVIRAFDDLKDDVIEIKQRTRELSEAVKQIAVYHSLSEEAVKNAWALYKKKLNGGTSKKTFSSEEFALLVQRIYGDGE